jgi:nucleoside-diphosphate-sugar epimerase
MSQELHVVVGAGSVGRATAELLGSLGHRVRVLSRRGRSVGIPVAECVACNAASVEQLTAAATGATAVYNCANPAYHRWTVEWPPLADALLTVAEQQGAVLATVSNLYVYGPVDGAMTPDLPMRPVGHKGSVRARMWRDALEAHEAGRVRAVEVRGSDYVCPSDQSHLGDRVAPRVLAGRPVRVLGRADQPHSWTAVRDVARTLVSVAADPRAHGRAWHVPSNPPRTQLEAVHDLCRVAGVDPVRVGTLPTVALRLAGLVRPEAGALVEVLYQFRRPFVLDDSATRLAYGIEPTPWEAVLAETLDAYRSGRAVRS